MEKWFTRLLSTNELKAFIDNAKIGNKNEKAFIGLVMPDAAERIQAVYGQGVKKIMLESEAVRHSYRVAYHNLQDDDLLLFADVVNTATDIKLSDTKHQNNTVIQMRKNIGEKIIFTVEVRIKHGGWLALVTCARK
ncbi:MAG: hypothetical protein LBK25_00755 [Treponema sp.]|jgi:hypothetical protein|nr:hypothetical protein [Treponema sp.]